MTIYKGRRKITTEFSAESLRDKSNVIKLLNSSRTIHLYNKAEIDYLINYKNGDQPILYKEKIVRDEINHKVVMNHAQMITRNIIGYFLGTPIQYIQNGLVENKEEIDLLNKFVSYEDKASTDKEIGEFQSIVGTAYRIVYTDGALGDEVPFEEKALHPATTYVVYENNIAEKPVLGVTYYNLLDEEGQVVGVKIYAYTEFGMHEFSTNDIGGLINDETEHEFFEYNVGGVPIIEYPNNQWRLGDWELCLGLMDAINELQSGRLDDIDQIVQSLLVFINADVNTDTYDEMRKMGVISLRNNTGNPSDVKTVTNSLDQSGMNLYSQELESMLYALIGIPDRNNRSGGGGDTGQAVELRDGWADMEIIARNKELAFKKSEKQTLRILLSIMNAKMKTSLSLLDIDIKFSRNKNNNLLVKTQAYSTLLATKTLDPADCLTIVDLVSDVNEYIDRGKKFWGEGFANAVVEKDPNVENASTVKEPPKEGDM